MSENSKKICKKRLYWFVGTFSNMSCLTTLKLIYTRAFVTKFLYHVTKNATVFSYPFSPLFHFSIIKGRKCAVVYTMWLFGYPNIL